jgi:hypothetical protein
MSNFSTKKMLLEKCSRPVLYIVSREDQSDIFQNVPKTEKSAMQQNK